MFSNLKITLESVNVIEFGSVSLLRDVKIKNLNNKNYCNL